MRGGQTLLGDDDEGTRVGAAHVIKNAMASIRVCLEQKGILYSDNLIVLRLGVSQVWIRTLDIRVNHVITPLFTTRQGRLGGRSMTTTTIIAT